MSLDIKKNIKIVKNQSYMNGGKSGELFFATYDHRVILKSIREDEAHSYLEKIKEFTDYFSKEPESLIVRILGILKFVRNDIKETPIYIMLMHNITLLPREVNLRVYDIKGSEFNRSTME
jgi:1-phosphatidylinositol-4-phosphate 5-kinase